MATGTIEKLLFTIITPDMVESVSFGLASGQYTSQNRLFALNINLTDAGIAETGYVRFQVAVYKRSIVMYGKKPNESWDTFGTINASS